jgi:hypothetical protein
MESGEYDHQAVESAARALWEERDVYRYDPSGAGPVFSVDTPPPYVSAAPLRLCLAETRRTAARYEDLWRRLGLPVDWSLRYSTPSRRSSPSTCTSGSTRNASGAASLHLTRWPAADPAWRSDRSAAGQLAVILDATRGLRSGLRPGNSARLRSLTLEAHTGPAAALLDGLDGVTVDIAAG